MKDLKHIFSYLKPYRRDLFLAIFLVFVECVFEMLIPLLMTDMVDVGVARRNIPFLLQQGGKMVLCAGLALVTGLLYARYAARASARSCVRRSTAGFRTMPSPTWTASPLPPWSPV